MKKQVQCRWDSATPISPERFQNPEACFRAAPFWAWNGKLEIETLSEQIDILKKMGFGGFHMHPRVGLSTPYLGEEFFAAVRFCVEKAEKLGMLAWLYDEDKWPSGFAGGYVTQNPEYRARYLLFTPWSYDEVAGKGSTNTSGAVAARSNNGVLLACYDIELDEGGCLQCWRKIKPQDSVQGKKWYAYLETPSPNPWYNDQTYVNTLDEKAIKAFVDYTHRAYREAVGEHFGGTIPAIFTDEPQFSHKIRLADGNKPGEVILPWTDDLPDTFFDFCGGDLLQDLPELIWELPEGKVSALRYNYHDHICERFAKVFADTCGNWCRENGIFLTGHMMEEPTLESQTKALGEAMRSYRAFDIPGIDMLCNWYEYNTAKQAQSAAHQQGAPGTLSELYGVTNWDFDFRGHKLHGDWQAALGVVIRVPHLAWMTMEGNAKRDYPASIFFQTPWYERYNLMEDHFSRVGLAMTRGKPLVRIGVVHPVESYWLHFGAEAQTYNIRAHMERRFSDLTQWLLFSTLDFDFLCESTLPALCDDTLPRSVGEMSYDVILVPGCETLRSTTFNFLERFAGGGGTVIVLGEYPAYMDALPAADVSILRQISACIPFSQYAVESALEEFRELWVQNIDGSPTCNLVSQMRKDGDALWLFLAQGKKPAHRDIAVRQDVIITVNGMLAVEKYDTMTGKISSLPCEHRNGKTEINACLWQHDSILLKFYPVAKMANIPDKRQEKAAYSQGVPVALPEIISLHMDEPNVLLLDMAEYALDSEPYLPKEEILRADNLLRGRLGWPLRQDAVVQPWAMTMQEEAEHQIRLRYTIESEIPVENAVLALERPEITGIILNGSTVTPKDIGWYVDPSIRKIELPALTARTNILEISMPYTKRINPEPCYLLGEFGVRLTGRRAVIIQMPSEFGFGSLTEQGLPFYGGSVCYETDFSCGAGKLELHAPQYRGGLISVDIDGEPAGDIVFSPYSVTVPNMKPGKHTLRLKAYGNRMNTMGALHNANPEYFWYGPDAWRTTGDEWCYEYKLRPFGILTSPQMRVYPK